MGDINKPKRKTSAITKSRGEKNSQGQREADLPKYARLVGFQNRVGIRRAELGRVDGTDFKQDENGYWCVVVEKGKGGKSQFERVLPKHLPFVRAYFDGAQEKLFSREEMNNKIDLHSMRSAVAREAYDYYLKQCEEPALREKLKQELVDRFCATNLSYRKSGFSPAILTKFKKEIEGTYKLKKGTIELAGEKGRPLVYDRTAVMMVSVFHLSHWRCDVTIRNYLLA